MIANYPFQFMEDPNSNKFQSSFRPARDWDCTGDTPIAMSELIPTRDIIPIIKALYGDWDDEVNGYMLPPRWSTENPEIFRFFFHEGFPINEMHASMLGGV